MKLLLLLLAAAPIAASPIAERAELMFPESPAAAEIYITDQEAALAEILDNLQDYDEALFLEALSLHTGSIWPYIRGEVELEELPADWDLVLWEYLRMEDEING